MSKFGLWMGVIGTLLLVSVFTSSQGSAPQTTVTRLVIVPNSDRPAIITGDGKVLLPNGENWQRLELDAKVEDFYMEGKTSYVATDQGVFRIQEGNAALETLPAHKIEEMHGFIFALGDQGVARRNANAWRLLDIPQPDKSAGALVMLGNHSHVLLNGSIYSTSDMGLSWERIGGLDNVQSIGVDQNEDLLATTDTGLYRWRDKTWSLLVQLPENKPVEKLQVFQDRLYALADGKLFRLIKGGWESVAFPAAIADLAMHYPDTLWVAEVGDQMLWSTEDGVNWQSTPIED